MIHRDTSVESFHEIRDNGLLSKRRLEVYEALYEHGPATANELVKAINGRRGFQTIYDGNICARLNELREMGVSREVTTRQCSISGMRTIAWDVTSNMPVPYAKPTSQLDALRIQLGKALELLSVARPDAHQISWEEWNKRYEEIAK